MTLGDTRTIAEDAVRAAGTVAAFNVITLEHAEGIVAALERTWGPH